MSTEAKTQGATTWHISTKALTYSQMDEYHNVKNKKYNLVVDAPACCKIGHQIWVQFEVEIIKSESYYNIQVSSN